MKLQLNKEYELKGFENLNSRNKEQLLLLVHWRTQTGLSYDRIIQDIINTCYPIKVKPSHPDYNARVVLRSTVRKQMTQLYKNHLIG
ncbi:hypothetical protein NE848_12840 [Gramella jeungdoensis]|uniref:DUF3263 domain-containing protein n=1 Tax=Gramella jeungdoensis TaxID=708091 RepID=A0ABT0Z3G3_9FLAO|nr:hypothetical protein [Gramella jeungdoensis]MCM8570273.1 hypothetical protein [Gramella jeungdoensis]